MVAAMFGQQMPRTSKHEIKGTPTVTIQKLSGTVIAVDGNKLLVRMASGDIRLFEPPESRQFIIDGKELTVRDLKPGTHLNAAVTTTITPVTERSTTIGSGKVWYVSGNTVIVTLPNNENRQYKVDDNYRFNIGGQKASVHELKKGMVINAEKIVESPRTVLAENIAVTGHAPPEPKPVRSEVAHTPGPSPAPTPRAEAVPAPAPSSRPEPAPVQVAKAPRPRLPDTASPLSLIGAVGLLFIAASFGLRFFSYRS